MRVFNSTALLTIALSILAASAIEWGGLAWYGRKLNALRTEVHALEAVQADTERPRPVSPLLLEYQLDLPGRGEIFPAMSKPTPDYWPVAILRITNTAGWASSELVSAEVPGWSRRLQTSVTVRSGETKPLPIRLEMLPRAEHNEELQQAVLEVRAEGPDHDVLFSASRPVLIHGGSEIYWGTKFANAQMAARWVTPHDPSVLELISRARKFLPAGHMAGYNGARGDSLSVAGRVRAQARAVFQAMEESGLSYVNSLYVMGKFVDSAQRIRLPGETLHLKTSNCMDVSVAFASAMENLGLQPILVIVPGHAFVGVRLAPGAQNILYLDLTVIPYGDFDAAVARAQNWLRRTTRGDQIVVDVTSARVLGIYPLSEEVF